MAKQYTAPHWRMLGDARHAEHLRQLAEADVCSECVASLHAFATSLESCTFESGVTLKPGQFAAELNMMRVVPGLWPSPAFAEALNACGLISGVEARAFCGFGWPARFNASWLKRLDRYYANVFAHAAAAGL